MYETVIKDIQKLIENKQSICIAIDGRCASGKTAFSKQLHTAIGGICMHMDDYFLRPVQRTSERYAEPGGNVDYERFKEEVLIPWSQKQSIRYQPFDCKSMTLMDAEEIPYQSILIVEGSYSMHPQLNDFYDYRIFMTVDKKKQIERIQKRNPDKIQKFQDIWIPYEEKYFQYYSIQKQCNTVMDTSEMF